MSRIYKNEFFQGHRSVPYYKIAITKPWTSLHIRVVIKCAMELVFGGMTKHI